MKLAPIWQRRLSRLIDGLILITVPAAAVILWRWYRDGGSFEAIYVAVGVALAALWAVRRRLRQELETTGTPLSDWGQPPAVGAGSTALRRQMEQVFDLDDLRLLTSDLHLHYDNLAGETLERKILSLVETCRKRNRLNELVDHLQQVRPHVQWAQPAALSTATNVQAQRNRKNLLNLVQTAWIEGFLKQSIHSEVLKLSMSYRPEAVDQRPWQLVLKQVGQAEQPVPPDCPLRDIFDRGGRNLLILGEPGSGKTITMLQLAESLIDAARHDPAEPLPIILNLSSWAQEKRPLAEWLAEEVFVQYGVARDLTRAWIAHHQFLYLLDGLDEVAAGVRDDCIAAINSFKEAHPAEMVVCSRTAEYEALQNRLHMGTAVRIKPLEDNQVDDYLRHKGLALQAVRATLAHDADLRELARTPLMLSLMTLAYRGLSHADLRPLADKAARRRHLFGHYLRQMFIRRPLPPHNTI